VVQVEPIKHTLKAPGTKQLKLKCDEPLSNFAFGLNLRRYTVARRVLRHSGGGSARRSGVLGGARVLGSS